MYAERNTFGAMGQSLSTDVTFVNAVEKRVANASSLDEPCQLCGAHKRFSVL